MNKWFSVKGPDGRLIDAAPDKTKCWTWEYAGRVDRALDAMRTLSDSWWRRAERIGYRCVEVEIVEAWALCEWHISDEGRAVPGCTEDDGVFRWDNVEMGWMNFCPHCGRKIVEKNADGGEKGEGKA